MTVRLKSTRPDDRVLALVTDAFGGYGGIAQYNRDFIAALATLPQVESIDVLPRLAPGPLEALPDKVRQHPAINARARYAAWAMAKALQTRPTIVFSGHLYHGPLADTLARITGARLVSQLHGTEIWGELEPRHRRPLERSDVVLTVSRDTRARLLAKADVEPERAHVINNTVGANFTPGDRLSSRAKFKIGRQFAILTVARLDSREGYKGHDRIIPLVAKFRQQGRDMLYLVAGIGDDQPRLEALALQLGVQDIVRFLGKVPGDDLPDLYRAADLFALPSSGEGFGIAFLEAMACGTPAVGLAIGGAPDALGDGELGWCGSEGDLKDAVDEASENMADNRTELSSRVHRRFGLPAFRARLGQAFT